MVENESEDSLEDQLDRCRDEETCSFGVFDAYRSAVRQVARHPPPEALSLLSTGEAYFTDHGESHLQRVQEKASNLIRSAGISLNCCEAFLLSLSIWTHDVGMLFSLREHEPIEEVRQVHHERTSEVLARIQQAMGLSELPAVLRPLLSTISSAHSRRVRIEDIPVESIVGRHRVRTQLLGAILRIADACDIDFRRAPESIFELYESGIPLESKAYWKKHSLVSGTTYDTLRASICAYVIPPEPNVPSEVNGIELLHWVQQELSKELESVASVFRQNQIPLYQVLLINNNSGVRLDVLNPPQQAPYVLIQVRRDVANLATFASLQEILTTHSGDHAVAIELIMPTGARVYVKSVSASFEPTEATLAEVRATLGDSWAGFHVKSDDRRGIQVINR